MTAHRDTVLQTGGDPRVCPEFFALRQEIAMLNQAGEPGPDWQQVEALAIALFRANGMDLQSVAWYTLARAHSAGLPGLCEGFEIITAMMKHQWPTLWPHPLSARLAIVTWLSAGIQQRLKVLQPQASDLDLLYRLQAQSEQNIKTLEVLACKHLSQLDSLAIQISELIAQFAASERQPQIDRMTAMASLARAGRGDEFTPLVYVPGDLTRSGALAVNFSFWARSRGFFAGMLAAFVLCTLGMWAFQLMEPELDKAQHIALLASQVTPERVGEDKNWQEAIVLAALPREQLVLWHTARLRLKKLLATATEAQRAGCLTYAEMEAQLFTVQQPLEAMQPTEELLRQLELNPLSPVLRGKTDHRLKQLLARYAIILQAPGQSNSASEK
ncbi:MAG TPA: hypothetical protein DEF05_07165 [Erwinia sp.]|uniref:type VI secretion system ImpA family N-terminal domain-containing protein n=1 Tax=Erwinia citreus TaxID=558 RepID=UPI000E933173|nr:type VI secretion system ImpA family N-terminal domain-containing protein [Erwinia sp.]HBV39454.1 hypothetical protein [Erwinia sp.]